ncbi:MAG: large subunit ribosomal protein L3 [Phycisphaerales bacterium]|jgi:large subunit ribosomal protein L3
MAKKAVKFDGPQLLGIKLGMTRIFTEDGRSHPVTVIEVKPNVVTQIRTQEADGYTAVQVGAGEVKARNTTIPMIGHDAKAGTSPKRDHCEFRMDDTSAFELGQELGVTSFEACAFVDVSGTSKGKGFQGGVKRHGFKGQQATHGVERKHRSPGSIGGHANNAGKAGRIKKGKKMAGQMGNTRVTMRSLEVMRIVPEQNLMLVKGPVPGCNKSIVEIRPSVRLYKSKGVKQAEMAK